MSNGQMIKDGTGKGFVAKVDADNRLHTHAFTVTIDQSAALKGDSFAVSSGVVNLTEATKSAIFYFKNTSNDDFLLNTQIFFVGPSVGGSSTAVGFEVSTGTGLTGSIVDNKLAGIETNARINSDNVLSADVFAGVEGDAVSGGTVSTFVSDGFVNTSPQVLPKGNAIAISVTPSTGNSDQNFQFSINLISNASTHGND